jgi:hypothetical protein
MEGIIMITGKFSVEMKPLENYTSGTDGVSLGRMSIDKTFSGDLSATSKGEMLSARIPDGDSAGYVAIEQVTGKLEGRQGSFVLQHFGVMDGENQRLILEVVPGSGREDLKGLSGKMQIRIEDGDHYYDFEYQL